MAICVLAPGEKFDTVVAKDAAILTKAGITHKQVADSFRRAFDAFEKQGGNKSGGKINKKISIIVVGFFGSAEYEKDGHRFEASHDYLVMIPGVASGNKAPTMYSETMPEYTMVSEMMPDLIEKLQFFEGKVEYGIKPKWAMELHRIMEKEGVFPSPIAKKRK